MQKFRDKKIVGWKLVQFVVRSTMSYKRDTLHHLQYRHPGLAVHRARNAVRQAWPFSRGAIKVSLQYTVYVLRRAVHRLEACGSLPATSHIVFLCFKFCFVCNQCCLYFRMCLLCHCIIQCSFVSRVQFAGDPVCVYQKFVPARIFCQAYLRCFVQCTCATPVVHQSCSCSAEHVTPEERIQITTLTLAVQNT